VSAEIAEALGRDVILHAEGKGIFDIEVDGHLVFSKYRVGRFPEPGEAARVIQALG
jgi:selT/selW/selH-like putative selenoprotein